MMRSEDKKEQRDRSKSLRQKVDDVERMGMELEHQGDALSEQGRYLADMSRATRDALNVYVPVDLLPLDRDWGALEKQASAVSGELRRIDLGALQSTAGSATYVTTTAFVPENIMHLVDLEEWPAVKPALDRLQALTSRSAKKDDVVALMLAFGLDRAISMRKSPLELFVTAHDAFARPVSDGDPAMTSLIPLRESIRAVIDRLLKQRPIQERAKNEPAKIRSIAKYLKRDTIPAETVESWVEQWSDLQDKLSTSKEKELAREEWLSSLNFGTLFLFNLLGGIDPGKTRHGRSESEGCF